MTINLFDIPAATTAYIDNEVVVEVIRVTANLTPDHDGSYTVRVTNAAAPNGVRLTDVTLHITVSEGEVVQLIPPGSALLFPRATGDTDDPRLPTDEPVDSMFVFFLAGDGDIEPNSTLDVGEVLELEFEYRANKRGTATISAHIHATVDPGDVFPRSGGDNGTADIRVRG